MTPKILSFSFAVCMASLCGCSTPTARLYANTAVPVTPTQQYPFKVTPVPQDLALAIHPQGLSPNQQVALSDYVSRWKSDGGGDVIVKMPVNTAGDPGVGRLTADATISFMKHLGMPAERLRLSAYDAAHAANAPVIASFERFEAVAPNCSDHWDDLTANKQNDVSSHFGCATTANIAVLVANPRDLVTPTQVDPSDNSRRQVVLGKYREGAVTSTSQDVQASGKLSQ